VSQQDDSGKASAPITHQTANPTIEVQRSQPPPDTESPPKTCEDCFNMPGNLQTVYILAIRSILARFKK
jgi:hypothetical protein